MRHSTLQAQVHFKLHIQVSRNMYVRDVRACLLSNVYHSRSYHPHNTDTISYIRVYALNVYELRAARNNNRNYFSPRFTRLGSCRKLVRYVYLCAMYECMYAFLCDVCIHELIRVSMHNVCMIYMHAHEQSNCL